MADELPPLLQSYDIEPRVKPGAIDAVIADVKRLATQVTNILNKLDVGPIKVNTKTGDTVKGQFTDIAKSIEVGFDGVQKRLESGIGAALDALIQKALAAQGQINNLGGPGGGGGGGGRRTNQDFFGPGVPERQSQSARSQELEKQRIFENADKINRELKKRQAADDEAAAKKAEADNNRIAQNRIRLQQASALLEKRQREDAAKDQESIELRKIRLAQNSAAIAKREREAAEKEEAAAADRRARLAQNSAAIENRRLETERRFREAQPARVSDATSGGTAAIKLQTQAETALAQARRASAEAARSDDPARRTATLQAERAATQAVTDATIARRAAEQRLLVTRNPASTQREIDSANQLASATARQARESIGLANASGKAAEALRPLGRNGREAHEQLLALLGVSRFLPGALGQAVSGVALLSGGMQSATGIFIGVAGAIATVLIQLGRMGAQFNEELNRQRAQAEGLGLTLTEVKAFQLVLGQTGGTIENFAVGIKKINEAVTGIGDSAIETKNLLELVFAGTGFDFTKVTASIEKGSASKQILLELAKNMRTLEKAGLGSAVAAQIFGRSWDEVKGRLQDIADKEEQFEKALKDSGITAKEAEESAKRYAQVVAELELAWTKFAATLGGPVTAIVKGFQVTLNFLTEDAQTTLDRMKGFAKSLEISGSEAAAKSIINLSKLREAVARGEELPKGTLGKATGTEDEFGVSQGLLDRASQQTKLDFLAAQIELNKQFIRKSGFDPDALIQQQKDRERELADEEAITENQKRLKEERQKQLEEAGKSASITERTATLKEHELAVAQDEQQLLQKQRQEEEKALKLAELVLKGDISDEKRADITEKRNAAKNRLIGLRIEENRLSKRIAALRKEERPTAALEADAEDITEALRSTDRSSTQFQLLADKLIKTREKILALARDPDERRRFSKQLFRDSQFIKGQTLEELQQQFAAAMVDIQEKSAQALDTIGRARERELIETDRLLESGSITVTEAARRDAQGILDVLNIATTEFEKKRREILLQIDKVQALKAAGKIKPDEADKATDRLQADLSAARIVQAKKEAAATNDVLKVDDRTTKQLIKNRQDLLSIEISTQESINRRRLELIRRASQDSIAVQEREAQEVHDNDIRINEQEQAKLLTFLNDRKKLIVKTITDAGLQTAVRASTNAFIRGLAGSDATEVLKTFKNLTIESLQELEEAQQKALSQGADISPEFLAFLREIITLKQKALDIDQTRDITIQDLAIKKANELLEIHRQEAELANDLLNFQQERLGFLKQEGLIGVLEANERQIDIEKQRLRLIQDQILEIRRRAQIRTAEVEQRNEALPPDQRRSITAVIASVQASPEISELQKELLRLGEQSIATSDKIRLLDSVLGRVRTGLDILIDAFDRAPESFDDFSTAILKRSLKGLAEAARGVQKLVDIIIGKDIQRKDPATELSLASEALKNDVVKAANDFKSIILQAAADFKSGSAAPPSGATAATITSGATGAAVNPKIKSQFAENVGKAVSKAFVVAGGLIAGLSAETIGGKIAGFGQIAGAFGPIGQAVAAGAQIVGGIADFIGAGFRKKAEKIAKDIQTNIGLINDKFKDGAITLGQSISQLSSQLASARNQLSGGKIGKKGGRAALAELEKDVNSQIADLRRQARDTQENFKKSLELLKLPTDFRSPFTTLQDALKTIKEFLNSFENANDAVAHFADAEDFLTLSVKELQDAAKAQIQDIIKQEQAAAEAFEKSRRDLLNQGRVKTIFDEAKDRLSQLFELERKRAEEQLKAEKDLANQNKLLDFINNIFKQFKSDLDALFATFRSPQLTSSFDSFSDNVNRMVGAAGRIADAGNPGALALQSQQRAQVSLSGDISVSISATSPSDAVRQITAGLQSTLSKVNPFAGWLPTARPVNP